MAIWLEGGGVARARLTRAALPGPLLGVGERGRLDMVGSQSRLAWKDEEGGGGLDSREATSGW